jgi:hypothetical protein
MSRALQQHFPRDVHAYRAIFVTDFLQGDTYAHKFASFFEKIARGCQ